jgi:hypothetical protein
MDLLETADKDLPLRDDIRLLGRILERLRLNAVFITASPGQRSNQCLEPAEADMRL